MSLDNWVSLDTRFVRGYNPYIGVIGYMGVLGYLGIIGLLGVVLRYMEIL